MSKTKATRNIQNVQTGWEPILEYAEDALHEAKLRVRQLTQAIRTLQVKIEAGEKFPGGMRNAASTHI
ncbi:MAG: hypothetical protein M3Y27_03585 [Acidobacteriota bacterium]|nr:hypothetical protein [Acidobacteriota bacterium]